MTTDLQQNGTKELIYSSAESAATASIERGKMILKLIAQHIRPNEVRVFGENLHFERGACEQILMWAGAHIKNQRLEKMEITDEKGERYYIFNAWGTVLIGDREIEVMGNCSTRSDFFGVKGGEFRPISEVDIPSVMIAAQTNMWNHACVRSLGLKSITLEDLKTAGMSIEKIERVDYAKGASGGSTLSTEDKQKQVQLGNWLLEMNGGDKASASAQLVKMTAFKGKDGDVAGVAECAKLTGKRLAIAYDKVLREYQSHCKANGLPVPNVAAKEELPTVNV